MVHRFLVAHPFSDVRFPQRIPHSRICPTKGEPARIPESLLRCCGKFFSPIANLPYPHIIEPVTALVDICHSFKTATQIVLIRPEISYVTPEYRLSHTRQNVFEQHVLGGV